jgi:hypothetical protein
MNDLYPPGNEIRIMLDPYNDEPYFVVNDVVQMLTGKRNVVQYLHKLRKCNADFEMRWRFGVHPIQVMTSRGVRSIAGANANNVLHLLELVPAPALWPLQQWMAELALNQLIATDNPKKISRKVFQLTNTTVRTGLTLRDHELRLETFIAQFAKAIHMNAQQHLASGEETRAVHETGYFRRLGSGGLGSSD